jgi:hypothetical protein
MLSVAYCDLISQFPLQFVTIYLNNRLLFSLDYFIRLSQSLSQCFSTGVPRNPRVPWASTKGSAGIYQGFRNNRIISFWFIYCPQFLLEWSKIYFYSTDLQHQPSRERSDTIKNGFEHTLQNLSMSMGFRKLYFVAKGVPRTFWGTKRVPHSQKGWETLF